MPEYIPPRLKIFDSDDSRKKATDKAPKLHERTVARNLGGRVRPASGALPGAKGDVSGVRVGEWETLVECKRTTNKSLSVKAEWLVKITAEAGTRIPILSIEFDESVIFSADKRFHLGIGGIGRTENRWVCMPESVFLLLQAAMGEKNGQDVGATNEKIDGDGGDDSP